MSDCALCREPASLTVFQCHPDPKLRQRYDVCLPCARAAVKSSLAKVEWVYVPIEHADAHPLAAEIKAAPAVASATI